MPIPAQGFTITWGGARLYDVQEMTITPPQPGDTPLARDGKPAIDGGVIRLASFEPVEKPRVGTALSRDSIADRLTVKVMGHVQGGPTRGSTRLVIVRGGWWIQLPDGSRIKLPTDFELPPASTTTVKAITLIDHVCRYEGGTISAVTNDVLRFDHQFTILSTTDSYGSGN